MHNAVCPKQTLYLFNPAQSAATTLIWCGLKFSWVHIIISLTSNSGEEDDFKSYEAGFNMNRGSICAGDKSRTSFFIYARNISLYVKGNYNVSKGQLSLRKASLHRNINIFICGKCAMINITRNRE